MMISYNVKTYFSIFGVIYFIIQIFIICLIIINKKNNKKKINKIASILNTSSIVIAMLFTFQAIDGFNRKLKLIGFTMIIFSGFVKGTLKKLKIT
ncbi:hypothetical protein ACTFIN_15345 [Clostridium cagae]|uniref:hypothetical protein n=1 Tax=Clostridium TaxID=1485 RepID=UPI0005412103|nr:MULTISPECIES: hypothetical protein [unclassified Clostridium]AIY81569.1 putative membrane protein [Clostridium botulinum 202F]KAI3344947.1 hypothetical protein CIT17_15120 [Clostridium botulinum]